MQVKALCASSCSLSSALAHFLPQDGVPRKQAAQDRRSGSPSYHANTDRLYPLSGEGGADIPCSGSTASQQQALQPLAKQKMQSRFRISDLGFRV